uniref:Uncharacterized protein n=1 Tax=Anguilla anguilla TaxID=7936 RepID=A0A0E9X4J5_ANGAN
MYSFCSLGKQNQTVVEIVLFNNYSDTTHIIVCFMTKLEMCACILCCSYI